MTSTGLSGREGSEWIETEMIGVRYHPKTETYLAVHEWASDESLSTNLVTVVGAILETDPSELPPLFECVDPDGLDRIFEPTESENPNRVSGRITFPYSGFLVTVYADGEIEISNHMSTYE